MQAVVLLSRPSRFSKLPSEFGNRKQLLGCPIIALIGSGNQLR